MRNKRRRQHKPKLKKKKTGNGRAETYRKVGTEDGEVILERTNIRSNLKKSRILERLQEELEIVNEEIVNVRARKQEIVDKIQIIKDIV